MTMFRFHKFYFLLTLFLFAIELFIGFYVNDRFVRPYVGDFLVVILLYCFFKSFLNTSTFTTAIGVLLIAYAIEASQYFQLVTRLGFQHHNILRTLIGTSFEWSDMIAYTLGILTVLLTEALLQKKRLTER